MASARQSYVSGPTAPPAWPVAQTAGWKVHCVLSQIVAQELGPLLQEARSV